MFVILVVIAILVGVLDRAKLARLDGRPGHRRDPPRHGQSQLPAQEQQEIMVQVDRVTTAFREKTISGEQLGLLAEKLVEVAAHVADGDASTIEKQYFAKSGLSDEEKTAGAMTLQRFIRGTIDEKINEAGIDAAMAHVADARSARRQLEAARNNSPTKSCGPSSPKPRSRPTRQAIPEQPAEIDPSEEIRKIVDEALLRERATGRTVSDPGRRARRLPTFEQPIAQRETCRDWGLRPIGERLVYRAIC